MLFFFLCLSVLQLIMTTTIALPFFSASARVCRRCYCCCCCCHQSCWQVSGSNWLCTDAYRADRRVECASSWSLLLVSSHHLIFILPIYFAPAFLMNAAAQRKWKERGKKEKSTCRHLWRGTAVLRSCMSCTVPRSQFGWWAHFTRQWSHQIERDIAGELKHYPSADAEQRQESLDATNAGAPPNIATQLWMTSPLILSSEPQIVLNDGK